MIMNSCCRIATAPKVVTWYTAGLDARHKWKKLSGLRSNRFSFEANCTSLYYVCLSAHSYVKLYYLQKLTDFRRTCRNIIQLEAIPSANFYSIMMPLQTHMSANQYRIQISHENIISVKENNNEFGQSVF